MLQIEKCFFIWIEYLIIVESVDSSENAEILTYARDMLMVMVAEEKSLGSKAKMATQVTELCMTIL